MKPLARDRIPQKEIVAGLQYDPLGSRSVLRIGARGWIVELDMSEMIRTNTPQFMTDENVRRGVAMKACNDPAFQLLVFRTPEAVAGAKIVARPLSTYRRGLIAARRRRAA